MREMNPQRWQKVMELFEQALDLEADEREAFIEEACADDDELRDSVWSLLEAHESEGPLDQRLFNLKSVLEEEDSQSLKGRRIGRYELVREINHGGMGSVYLARRADGQFSQQVALKLIGAALPSDEAVQRFIAERQILASLNHPNIAHLLDGGLTGEGHPYIVMEYVDGEPIDDYCNRLQLSVEERLELFLSICDAVQYAHRSLVIHRDLKPSNMLVTEDGTVKLLDFGIAKLIEPDAVLSDAAPRTQTGLLPMTPAYASPEQVRGEAVTTASDVYQLGVVLYELLTGRRPYHVSGRTPSEVERVICQQQPTRPSASITRTLASDDQVEDKLPSDVLDSSPSKLQSRLRGDIDTIVMKALCKEPDLRYESAKQLADDIQRHLSGRPVTAHPYTWGYRTRKFIERHRGGVAVAVVITLLLLGYAATITWHSQQTQLALEQSEREAVKSEQVTSFLISMFEQADPYGAESPVTTFSDTLSRLDLLDQGVDRVRNELVGQPEVQARMKYTLGRLYRQMGHYEEASPLLENAVLLQREHLEADHPDLALSLHEFARLLRHKGELERPEQLYREALEIQYRHLGEAHPDIAENLNELAIIAARSGNLNRADSLFQEALQMQQSILGDDHPDVASTIVRMAILYLLKEEYETAEFHLRESLAMYQNHFGPGHPHVAASLDRLGQALLQQGKLDEAEPLLKRAKTIRDERFRGDHPDVAISLNNLGELRMKQGKYTEADQLHEQAQKIYQQLYGAQNMDAAATIFKRGHAHRASGDVERAEAFYQQALTMQKSLHGVNNYYTRQYIDTLITLYDRHNQPAKADSLQLMIAESQN